MPDNGHNLKVSDSDTVARAELTLTYDKGDRPPFVVFIRRADNVLNKNKASRLDPIAVACVVTSFAKEQIIEIKASGRNRIAIHFSDLNMANTTLSHPSLKEAGLIAFIPSFNILRTGVIRNVPLDISEDDIAKRTVLIKFRGQFLPRSVFFMHVSFPVSPYFPRVFICFSCLRYGHVIANCKSKSRCERCGKAKHPVPDECPRIQLPPLCCNCGGEHLPSASNCPAFLKQKLYATAAIENISYVEARSKLGGPSPFVFLPPNSFHPSEFPSLLHTHNPPRPLINYQDLMTEIPLSSSSRPDISRSYATASSSMAPSNGCPYPSPSCEPFMQASTSAPRNYHNLSHNHKK
ncbi:hypothetical protein ALC62_12361 [Cyphomyrmex costatus]|uniref:CCHC-type domain-containing protein n=1 Tax=Cyphomyrmex costatus TaxID=456900 RepID=A0A151IBF4_9HYME|nr:hypothetical protein ALC62_12361 [Cyphomyrmex costatus]